MKLSAIKTLLGTLNLSRYPITTLTDKGDKYEFDILSNIEKDRILAKAQPSICGLFDRPVETKARIR